MQSYHHNHKNCGNSNTALAGVSRSIIIFRQILSNFDWFKLLIYIESWCGDTDLGFGYMCSWWTWLHYRVCCFANELWSWWVTGYGSCCGLGMCVLIHLMGPSPLIDNYPSDPSKVIIVVPKHNSSQSMISPQSTLFGHSNILHPHIKTSIGWHDSETSTIVRYNPSEQNLLASHTFLVWIMI